MRAHWRFLLDIEGRGTQEYLLIFRVGRPCGERGSQAEGLKDLHSRPSLIASLRGVANLWKN